MNKLQAKKNETDAVHHCSKNFNSISLTPGINFKFLVFCSFSKLKQNQEY